MPINVNPQGTLTKLKRIKAGKSRNLKEIKDLAGHSQKLLETIRNFPKGKPSRTRKERSVGNAREVKFNRDPHFGKTFSAATFFRELQRMESEAYANVGNRGLQWVGDSYYRYEKLYSLMHRDRNHYERLCRCREYYRIIQTLALRCIGAVTIAELWPGLAPEKVVEDWRCLGLFVGSVYQKVPVGELCMTCPDPRTIEAYAKKDRHYRKVSTKYSKWVVGRERHCQGPKSDFVFANYYAPGAVHR
jgi:hypothetical protein